MPSFHEVCKESGVDMLANPRFMIVPLRESNLVYLADVADSRPKFEKTRLQVREVKADQIHRIAREFGRHYGSGEVARQRIAALWAEMHGRIRFGTRLLSITGRMPGISDIIVTSGRGDARLRVAVLRGREPTVTFKFLKHIDVSDKIVAATRFEPKDAQWMTDELNSVYAPQTNITFRLLRSEWVTVRQIRQLPVTKQMALDYLVTLRDGDADVTVFLVGDGDTHGFHLVGRRVCVVDDFPKSIMPRDDPRGPYSDEWLRYDIEKLRGNAPLPPFNTDQRQAFVTVLAHEVGHALGADHHRRENVLMSTGVESTKIDRDLALELNPW